MNNCPCGFHAIIVVVIGIAMDTPPLIAQKKTYSLQYLTDKAVTISLSLKSKQATINAFKASLTDLQHSFLPKIILSEQLGLASDNSLAGTYFPVANIPSTSGGIRVSNNGQPASTQLASLYGEYPITTFGLREAKLEQARANINLEDADFQRLRYDLIYKTAKLYFNIQKAQNRLKEDQLNIERYQSILTVIQALANSGLKPGSDTSLAKAELSKTRIGYNQTLGSLLQFKQQLSFLTGIPAQSILIDTLKMDNTPVMDTTSFNSSLLKNNPYLKYYQKKKETFISIDKLLHKSYYPNLNMVGAGWLRGSSIQYNDQYKDLYNGLGIQRYNYALGVQFTYNLFNKVFQKDKLSINQLQEQASIYDESLQELVLETQNHQADDAIQTIMLNLKEIPIQLQAAKETYLQKNAQYKAGIISLIDLTNASFVLYRSETDNIETLGDLYLARLDKAAAMGNLIPFIQTIP